MSENIGLIFIGLSIDDQIGSFLLWQPILFMNGQTQPDLHSNLCGKEVFLVFLYADLFARPFQSDRLHFAAQTSSTIGVRRVKDFIGR